MTEGSIPQTQTPPAWANILRSAIEIGPKVAVTAGATCYGLGILIVSSHLARLGIYTTDFLRTEFVLVGAAFCVLTLCAAVATHYLIVFVNDAVDLWKNKKYLRAAGRLVLTCWASLFVFVQLLTLISTEKFASYTNWRMWVTLGIAIFTYLAVRNTLRIFRQVWAATIEQGDKKIRMEHWWDLAFTLIWLLGNIGTYTEVVYPHLLAQYGGGYRQAEILIPTTEGQRAGHIAGLPFRPDGSIGPVQLLLENEQELTVATMDDARAVSIARDLVEAVAEYKRPQTNAKASNKSRAVTAPRASPNTAPAVPVAPPNARSLGPPKGDSK